MSASIFVCGTFIGLASALKSGSRRRIDEPQQQHQQQQRRQRKSHCNDGAAVAVVISYLIQIHGPTDCCKPEWVASLQSLSRFQLSFTSGSSNVTRAVKNKKEKHFAEDFYAALVISIFMCNFSVRVSVCGCVWVCCAVAAGEWQTGYITIIKACPCHRAAYIQHQYLPVFLSIFMQTYIYFSINLSVNNAVGHDKNNNNNYNNNNYYYNYNLIQSIRTKLKCKLLTTHNYNYKNNPTYY